LQTAERRSLHASAFFVYVGNWKSGAGAFALAIAGLMNDAHAAQFLGIVAAVEHVPFFGAFGDFFFSVS